MVAYTTTAYYISPSGKLVKQTMTFVKVNKDEAAESISVTKPCIKVEIA